MANQWFRMYSEFATDAKVQSMSEAMQRRLMMLFCLRCSNGIATLQCNELAFALHITEEELEETKALFVRKGFIDDAWNVLNWDKRQFISDSSTDRSRKHREAKRKAEHQRNDGATDVQRCGNDGATAPDTDTDTDISPLPPSQGGKPKRKPRSGLPDGFKPNDDGMAKAVAAGLDVSRELERFRDHHAGAGTLAADWQATWRTWVGKAVEFGRGGKRGVPVQERSPQWAIAAGFPSVWQAQNAGCTARNAHQFRDGKRVEVTA